MATGGKASTYGKVILAQHAVSGVCPVILLEHNVLLVLAALNDLIGTSLQFSAKLANQRYNERRHDRENELSELVLKLLHDLREYWDLLKSSRDT